MKITSTKISNVNYVQIYLTEEELKKQETKEVIEKYRKMQCSNFSNWKRELSRNS